jgi:hypothetical protein
MKIALNAAVALTLCAFLLAGNARAQTEPEAAPAPGTTTHVPPGIIVTPPMAPPTNTQQNCPDTRHKLELIG